MPTGIEWTDETLNFATGCTKVGGPDSECANCYMFRQWPRLRGFGVRGYAGEPDQVTVMPERLDQLYRWARPRRVFINSMSDTFHRDVPWRVVMRMMQAAIDNPQHTLQVLTKRPGQAAAFYEQMWRVSGDSEQGCLDCDLPLSHMRHGPGRGDHGYLIPPRPWPENVWLGTSVGRQRFAHRITVLGRVPAPVRFVSAEPLLEHLTLYNWMRTGTTVGMTDPTGRRLIDWLIVGGESGPRSRPMEARWARALRDEAVMARVPFFLKQHGDAAGPRHGGRILDGRTWDEFPPERQAVMV